MARWKPFPYDNAEFLYEGKALKARWPDLHRGDCVAFPADERLQEAWRCFHRGDFARAVTLADQVGIEGHAAANKATGIHATYLEDNETRRIECYTSAIRRAERAIAALPRDPNAHYFLAFNLGRYAQSISVLKALKQGIGGRIADALKRTLELQPKHAEAHTAMGMYHAEIIDKVGRLIGAMTYGASEKDAISHFQQALRLTPGSPIAHIEYANGLYLMHGDERLNEVTELYVRASELQPRDAMERLDVESAAAELE